MVKTTDSSRSKLYAGLAGVAALALFSACGTDEPTQEEPAPADPEVEQEDPAQEDPMGQDPAEGEDPAEDPMQDDSMEEDTEVEGAGIDEATSIVGLAGNAVSWSL